ncbi:MAG: hypothetical protein DI624_06495 [Brevundimonas sp.]|uniref:FecR family protein n=1 Tax=Brevundimonas sp. TaxID=1871086 RepID=UPI000DB7F3E6|nr:FecR domain-containing protein [Brevundimonas sp.]PZT99000.1 MAG: hypothetical protein DI624_06495 [Brevundimonas sp.]
MEKERIGLATERESSLAIEAEAAQWVARSDRGPLSAPDQARLDEWLAGDSRRLGAYARLSALFWRTERGEVLAYDDTAAAGRRTWAVRLVEKTRSGMDRRRLLMGGGMAAAATATVGGLALWGGSGGTAYATTLGEVRRIPLGERVTATLNTDTALRSKRAGQIELMKGEALFEVGAEDALPFRLNIRDVDVQTGGAVFAVRRFADGGLGLWVRQGMLRLDHRKKKFAPTRVSEGFSVRLAGALDASLEVSPITPEAMGRILAWREGELAFADDTLAFAAAEFARYGGPPIVIADPQLGRSAISGWFPARDPAAFATAAATVFDATVRIESDRIVLDSR